MDDLMLDAPMFDDRDGGRRRPVWQVLAAGLGAVALALGVGIGLAASGGGADGGASVSAAPRGGSGGDQSDDQPRDQGEQGDQAGDDQPQDQADTGDDSSDGVPDAGPPIRDDHDEPTVMENEVEPVVLKSSSGGATERTFHWHWDIPAGNILYLNEFSCPSEAPYIKTNGSYRTPNKKPEIKAWHIADARMEVSSGVGYGAFNQVRSTEDSDQFQLLTGWPKGSIIDNNVWAPPFEKGTADLYVTCTSSSAHADVAYALPGYGAGAALPWGYH